MLGCAYCVAPRLREPALPAPPKRRPQATAPPRSAGHYLSNRSVPHGGNHHLAMAHFVRRIAFLITAAGALAVGIIPASNAQTAISSLSIRLAPGPTQVDTFAFQSYGGWTTANAFITAKSDSSHNLYVSKATFEQTGIRFFDQKSDDSLNFSAPYWMYGGTSFFNLTTEAGTQFFAIRSLSNSQMVFESVDSNAKAWKFVVQNGQPITQVYDNDSLGKAGVANDSSFRNYTMSWKITSTNDTAWSVHSQDLITYVTRNVDSTAAIAPGQTFAIAHGIVGRNAGPDDDVNGKIISQGPQHIWIGKDTTIGPALRGTFNFTNHAPTDQTIQSGSVDLQNYSPVLGVKEFVFPFEMNVNKIRIYYLSSDDNALLPGTPGIDSTFHVALASYSIGNDNGTVGTSFGWNDLTGIRGQPFYDFISSKNGTLSDTTILLEFTSNGSKYIVADSSMEVASHHTGIGYYFNQFTDINGFTYSISNDRDTIFVSEGPHTLMRAASVAYNTQSPWEPAPPAPKAVTILEPTEGQVFQDINSLAVLFTSTGAVYRVAITGPATADTLMLKDTSRSISVPSVNFSGTPGAYTLTVTPYNLEGAAGPSAEVHFAIAPEQGVAEETQREGFSIFPNPAGGTSTIQFSLASPEFCSLAIFDAVGREVSRPVSGVMESAGTHDVPFDTRKLSAGIYTVRLTAGGSAKVAKLVVR